MFRLLVLIICSSWKWRQKKKKMKFRMWWLFDYFAKLPLLCCYFNDGMQWMLVMLFQHISLWVLSSCIWCIWSFAFTEFLLNLLQCLVGLKPVRGIIISLNISTWFLPFRFLYTSSQWEIFSFCFYYVWCNGILYSL